MLLSIKQHIEVENLTHKQWKAEIFLHLKIFSAHIIHGAYLYRKQNINIFNETTQKNHKKIIYMFDIDNYVTREKLSYRKCNYLLRQNFEAKFNEYFKTRWQQ